MKKLLILALLTSPGWSEPWTNKLSPRMREAFKSMARDDWKPQQAAELTPTEKRDLQQFWKSAQQSQVPKVLPPTQPSSSLPKTEPTQISPRQH